MECQALKIPDHDFSRKAIGISVRCKCNKLERV